MPASWPRPVPTVGDRTSAAERAADPAAWALPKADREALGRVIAARRDIRRFRPDQVPGSLLMSVLEAAHAGPSVGHSQPWRFVIVSEEATRSRAAVMADQARLAQAAAMDPESGRHLLDLDLEGIREAPVGVVVCCDRRTPAQGVLGRATFRDADLWSCACAIENLWLAARSEGLGVGWVTLFEPGDLADLIGAPPGVETLGWLCLGWPDERPPTPGLERRGWSQRLPLETVVLKERWPDPRPGSPPPPFSRLATMPAPEAVVAAHDSSDAILSTPGSLGALDKAVDKVVALGRQADCVAGGSAVIVAADHPVAGLGVSAFAIEVTREVTQASVAGVSVGAVAAQAAGLSLVVVDAGVEGAPIAGALECRPSDHRGDLVSADALTHGDLRFLLDAGARLGEKLGAPGGGLVAIGEVGIANTTVAAALAAGLLEADASSVVGLGAGSDSAILQRKTAVVSAALDRVRAEPGVVAGPRDWLQRVGGPDIAYLTGVVEGVAHAGGVVLLDGLATSVAALVAVMAEPAVASHLVAGQRSRELAHPAVLQALGLEPLLDLRIRAGEGAGASLAAGVLKAGLRVRLEVARTTPR
jgi:nicotinate-nucleotide--dimethylbenzimidazole phosphoribosyltransferase